MNFPELERITIDPKVMGGKPCIRGIRVTVGTITGLLASGETIEKILELYPYLDKEDIYAALAYATWRTEEYDIPLKAPWEFLLDMNIPQIWESYLKAAGHEAIHWSKIGNIRAEDVEIMEWARENQYVVFTHDCDFGSLLYVTNAEAPSVIQLRVEHILPETVGNAVLETLKTTSDKLKVGALVTIDPRRHRIRALPLKNDNS